MKTKIPTVSVVMPVYNSDKYLSLAIDSILHQSYRDFEFIIINDASKDSSSAILNKYKKKDKRIKVIRNKSNLGVTKSLNIGVLKARGKYIIRMDADDWSHPERFKYQVQLMKKNPDIVVSGSDIEVCDENLQPTYIRHYHNTDQEIRKHIFRYSPFAHPATIWRSDVLKKELYNEILTTSQDYELYFRVGKIGKFMNINKCLLKLRLHTKSVSAIQNDLQWKNTVLIRFTAVLIHGYQMTTVDKVYAFMQEICIAILPVSMRFKLFNLIRRLSIY